MKDVTHTHQTPNLRYGRLITLLATSWGVDVSVGETRPVPVAFSSKNINLMHLRLYPPNINPRRGRTAGVRIQEPEVGQGEEDGGDDTIMGDDTGRDDMSSGQSQVLQALYDKVESIGNQVVSLGHQFESLNTRNEQRWDSFQHGFEQTMAHYFGPMGRPPPPQSFFTYYGSGSSQQPGPSEQPSSSQQPGSSQ